MKTIEYLPKALEGVLITDMTLGAILRGVTPELPAEKRYNLYNDKRVTLDPRRMALPSI